MTLVGERMAHIGVIGGSGFYSLLDDSEEFDIKTPFHNDPVKVFVGDYNGKEIAFIPRHGPGHRYAPHKIPYKAHIWALKSLGVHDVIAPCAVGSLKKEIKPGDFVVFDQFVDRTSGRDDTFYHDSPVIHVAGAHPYCPKLREITIEAAKELNIPIKESGTVVVIQGPRFSTAAESKWFSDQGWDVVNMTQYPECILTKEQEMCYVGIGLVTDYDAGIHGGETVNLAKVIEVLNKNNELVKLLIKRMIEKISADDCTCHHSLDGARVG